MVTQNAAHPIRTPCIGVCSTVFGDQVCRGCKRFANEVIDWNAYQEVQKRQVENRLGTLLQQVLVDKLRVTDQALLADRLAQRHVRYSRHRPDLCWVMDLIRATGGNIGDPTDWGFELLPPWHGGPLWKLQNQVDTEFFELSEAHYQRYIAPPTRIDGH